MLSIITCSIKPEQLKAFKKNIEDTIGIPFELIAFDNRVHQYGLCKVYNECARQAKYDFLCFAHEDISFQTYDWGKIIISELSKPDCGVIGFAGASHKSLTISGWHSSAQYDRFNFIQQSPQETSPRPHYFNPTKNDFPEVIVLDGFCMFVRRNVWKKMPFDEKTFTGFHLYDLDFSMQIAQKYTNKVCFPIKVIHFSDGNFTDEWLNNSIIFHKKWEKSLPLYISTPSKKDILADERKTSRKLVKMLIRNKLNPQTIKPFLIKHTRKYPLRWGTLTLWFKFLRYKKQLS